MKVKEWRHLAFGLAIVSALGGLSISCARPGQPSRLAGRGPASQVAKTVSSAQGRVRLAYFPNVTHAPALVGVAHGYFQRALPEGVALDTRVFNAGPEEMEALLAGEVDVGYVGPSPAINTYLRSHGRALRVVAGACSGGACLVARRDSPITGIASLGGKRLAVPQLANTQDVSARHFLSVQGLRPREKGGTVEVLPVRNPDILVLFLRKQLDAAWVPEPWASRLILEADARLVLDERDLWPQGRFTTTVMIVRRGFLEQHPDWVEAMLRAHIKAINWLKQDADEAQTAVNAELLRLTGKKLPTEVLQQAWRRLEFTTDPIRSSMETFVGAAGDAGYLPAELRDVQALFELTLLGRAHQQVGS